MSVFICFMKMLWSSLLCVKFCMWYTGYIDVITWLLCFTRSVLRCLDTGLVFLAESYSSMYAAKNHCYSSVCKCSARSLLVLADALAWVSFLPVLQLCIPVHAGGGQREERQGREPWLSVSCRLVCPTAGSRLIAWSCSSSGALLGATLLQSSFSGGKISSHVKPNVWRWKNGLPALIPLLLAFCYAFDERQSSKSGVGFWKT